MEPNHLVGLSVLFISILVNRLFSEKSMKLLNSDEKVGLIDTFSSFRKVNIITMVVVVIIYFGGIYLFPQFHLFFLIALIVLVLASFIVVTFYVVDKLKSINIPGAYIKNYLIGRGILALGKIGAISFFFFF